MNRRYQFLKNLLIITGVIEVSVALVHFIMPYFIHQNSGFIALESGEADFITLLIHAVGILLLAFGALTILLAKYVNNTIELIYFYLMIKVALWVLRVGLELVYPVQLNMFFIEPFTLIVLPGLVFELLLFVVALVISKQMKGEVMKDEVWKSTDK